MGKKSTRDALTPDCFKDEFFYSVNDTICTTCPFYYCCGANKYGEELFKRVSGNRKSIETFMAQKRVSNKHAIEAIRKLFGVSANAAALSYGRRRRKVR